MTKANQMNKRQREQLAHIAAARKHAPKQEKPLVCGNGYARGGKSRIGEVVRYGDYLRRTVVTDYDFVSFDESSPIDKDAYARLSAALANGDLRIQLFKSKPHESSGQINAAIPLIK